MSRLLVICCIRYIQQSNSDGDVIQTFTGRLGSIKYGDGYVRYVDEDNVEHNIYLNDYALIGIGEVIE